jgi:hypothetical protein
MIGDVFLTVVGCRSLLVRLLVWSKDCGLTMIQYLFGDVPSQYLQIEWQC